MKELETIVESRVRPLLAGAMHEKLGVTIAEIQSDISDKLKRSALLEYDVDTALPFKQAKKRFKRQYVARLLQLNSGNVADVARIAEVDRRSIHRIIAEAKIEVQKFREMFDRAYFKQMAVQDIIQGSLEQYKSSLHPVKYKALYSEAPQLSKNIVRELPESPKTLKEAEKEFERRYLEVVLAENQNNISKTARKIGLRFETLHRKLKSLGLLPGQSQ